ncbi:PTS system mannose/fructose/N-acetylgalactosamine-transporter subunit IIB [Pectinatus haikarae]|uniref:PTS system mannose-specific IIB component n=1 Tax=Pectinatus haikarae TaxID=349096 RepID=A0ABT9YAP0_9FIRM|nr:PTS sugar transporter subunit IIB [Pectinatus haikarae]MDQ0204601.1 PTS system mannose-specific IIB component [Pectinatus haikarae]
MLNIVLTRIDDRLIHGQVVTAWAKVTKGNRIVVVDDGVANDDFMSKIIKMAAPASFKIGIHTIEQAAEILKQDDTGERVIVLVKTPVTVQALMDKGVKIKELDLGGMGATKGRKQLYRNISISEAEKDCFRQLIDKGVHVVVQIVPDDSPKDIQNFF